MKDFQFYIDCYESIDSKNFPLNSYGPHSPEEVGIIVNKILKNQKSGINEIKISKKSIGQSVIKDIL